MAVEIAAIQGLIELKDEYSSRLKLAEAALSKFSETNQESLKAVAGAAGLVTVAFGAVASSAIALGSRGATINDVSATLDHFAGSAEDAKKIMDGLREGTQGTVDKFTLMKNASHLLSSEVKLSAEDFKTLGEATFVLQNRGLHGTAEMMDLVSNALINGKAKSLEAELGIINLDKAEQAYAKTLGVRVDQLSQAGIVEAHRIAIMEKMRAVVRDAGQQELDFGERLEATSAFLTDWVNDVGSAIAKSSVLAVGMKEIGAAVSEAFGNDKQDSIKMVVHWIEQGAIVAVDFGLGAIELARVVNVAWSGIKTIILGTETVIVGIGETVAGTIAMVTSAAASLPGASEGIKDMARQAQEGADHLKEMTNSLAAETAEAAKGLVGNSAFDKTLDSMGGTLLRVKDAMVAASNATDENTEKVDIAAQNARRLKVAQDEIAKSMTNRVKIEQELWKIEEKSLKETANNWDEYFSQLAKHSGTTHDAMRADIEATFNKAVTALDAQDRNFAENYRSLRAVADENLKAVGSDWDSVKDKSLEALAQTAARARQTYADMVTGSLHFSREALEEQRQKIIDADNAMRGYGKNSVAAQQAAAAATAKQNAELEKQRAAIEAAADAERRRKMGGSVEYDLSTPEGRSKMDPIIAKFLHDGYSLAQAAALAFAERSGTPVNQNDPLFKTKGPRVPGFAEGGIVTVGERGPEAVRLPFGSEVYPSGVRPPSGPAGMTINLNFQVNGNAQESARQIKQIMMRELKSIHKFGTA